MSYQIPASIAGRVGLALVGRVPYAWAKGSPASSSWDLIVEGADCGGFYGALARQSGLVGVDCPDMNSTGWANAMDVVDAADVREGDAAIYPGHIAWVHCRMPDGNVVILGANGGDSDTHADDPKAYVRAEYDGDYRGDLTCYARLKPSFQATTGAVSVDEECAFGELPSGLVAFIVRVAAQLDGFDWTSMRFTLNRAGRVSTSRTLDRFIASWLDHRARGTGVAGAVAQAYDTVTDYVQDAWDWVTE